MNNQDLPAIIRSAVAARRLQLNQMVYQRLGGVVRYGPLAGYRLIEQSSWGNDKAAKLLGFYELELVDQLKTALSPRKLFLDIGAADGYYAVGLVHAGLVQRCLAFELTPAGREVITTTAAGLGLESRVEVRGACDEPALLEALQGVDTRELVVLSDVEGAEFDIFTDRVLAALAGASVFIEIHDHSAEGPARYAELAARARRWFSLTEIRKGGRNPYHYQELQDLDDTDHWLVCSEGRDPDQKWLALRPIHG